MTPSREDAIRLRAFQIWEAEGRPDGRALDHWQRASTEIDSVAPTAATARPTAERVPPGTAKPVGAIAAARPTPRRSVAAAPKVAR
ncbi:MAG: DUF2934 domain-containing protein [Bauldia sp.]